MRWLRSVILWIFSAYKIKAEIDVSGDVNERLSKIEKQLQRIELSPLPVGLVCSGLPVMMIGISGIIDSILNGTGYETIDFTYYAIGTFMVCNGLRLHYKRNKEAWIVLIISIAFLLVTIFIRSLLFTSSL